MENNKFIMINLDDERSKDIADVLGNKTCKKILDYLAETKEASEKDISDKLSIPMNTAEYNLNKLVSSGLIEKSKGFFWSVKGKKIDMYRLSNKRIVISPKSLFRGIVPAFVGVALISLGIKLFSNNSLVNNDFSAPVYDSVEKSVETSAASGVASTSSNALQGASDSIMTEKANVIQRCGEYIQGSCANSSMDTWAWFLLGGLVAILIFLLWNQFKQRMKGGF